LLLVAQALSLCAFDVVFQVSYIFSAAPFAQTNLAALLRVDP